MSDVNNIYDFIIVGAGPAGLSAAIYAARRNLKTLVITKDIGGLMIMTHQVENYPGFDAIPGYELMSKFKEQAEKFGAKFEFAAVSRLEKKADYFCVELAKGKKICGQAVLLAFGLSNRRLNVPGEDKFKGRGVNYCATCDGPLYRGKTVAVVGGGNSALEAALYLSGLARQVYVINRTDQFRAEPALLGRVRQRKNIEFYCEAQIAEITGDTKVKSIVLASTPDPNRRQELPAEGVFIEIGYEPNTGWLKDLVRLNERGEIIIDENGCTSAAGIYAAGDCTNASYKQIIIAAGAGAKASLEAYKHIVAHSGNELGDWGQCELVGADKTVKIKLQK